MSRGQQSYSLSRDRESAVSPDIQARFIARQRTIWMIIILVHRSSVEMCCVSLHVLQGSHMADSFVNNSIIVRRDVEDPILLVTDFCLLWSTYIQRA